MQLQSGTLLQGGKYKIERVLGQGGFGITYLAKQELFDRHVCIKEFFFKDYCERGAQGEVTSCTTNSKELVDRFLNKFIKEARTISRLDHPNIVRILDIFQENGTAYYAMEYIEGCSLADKVNAQGALSEAVAVDYIKQVASALDYIHQRSINHLDVKPANIMVRQSDNKAILIDFGLSKQYDEQGGQTSTTPVGISHGYAPMEQYNQGGVSTFSPQTDIYSLGATLYKLVTGNTPPQAIEIFNEGLTGLPQSLSHNLVAAIKKTMQPKKGDRPQSIGEFTALLGGQFAAIPNSSISPSHSDESTRIIGTTNSKPAKNISSPQPKIAKIEEVREKKGKNSMGMLGVVILGVAIIIVCFVFVTPWEAGIDNCDNNNQSYSSAPQQQSQTSKPQQPVKEDSAAPTTTLAKVKETQRIAEEKQMEKVSVKAEKAKRVQLTGTINGHEWVDLGLSVKWATCNIGASSPSDYGNHYAWGETSTKYDYVNSNCKTWEKSMSSIAGSVSYDAARANWGGTWRLPTKAEFQELIVKCTWTQFSQGGHNGCKVTGKNGKSIFLPAAGWRYGTLLDYAEGAGSYWSATPDENGMQGAYSLYFSGLAHSVNWDGRYVGRSVRPVSE